MLCLLAPSLGLGLRTGQTDFECLDLGTGLGFGTYDLDGWHQVLLKPGDVQHGAQRMDHFPPCLHRTLEGHRIISAAHGPTPDS